MFSIEIQALRTEKKSKQHERNALKSLIQNKKLNN